MDTRKTHAERRMEVELAAVEEDVVRKRVGKNPFDEKFTSLVRTGV